MYPINKYLFENIFDKVNELYQEFMRSIDNEYLETIHNLKNVNTTLDIRLMIHKILSVVINLSDKNHEIIYYCRLALSIDKNENNTKHYSEYIKMITTYDKAIMGLTEV